MFSIQQIANIWVHFFNESLQISYPKKYPWFS